MYGLHNCDSLSCTNFLISCGLLTTHTCVLALCMPVVIQAGMSRPNLACRITEKKQCNVCVPTHY